MPPVYTDADIAALVAEGKPLPDDWRDRIQLKTKRGHSERDIELPGENGGEYRLILRHNTVNNLDFSLIVAVRVPGSSRLFRLRRYNGKSHEHTNHIEGETFYNFHIHQATTRYQEYGTREDAFAEPTDRYGDYHEALRCLITDINLIVPPEIQTSLFEEF